MYGARAPIEGDKMIHSNNQIEEVTTCQMQAWPTWEPNEILPGLWQGGTQDEGVIGCPIPTGHYGFESNFDVVVTLYADAQPAPWGVEEFRFGFPDANMRPIFVERIVAMAMLAHSRWRNGHEVLIRCQAGVNRSGLVMALVLMLSGRTADEAITLIRERRSAYALCNPAFEQWLRDEAAGVLADLAVAA